MNWLSNLPPGIKNMFKKQDAGPDSLWVKCGGCGEMLFSRDLEAALQVCPSCGFHMRITPAQRLAALFDGGQYETVAVPEPPTDPLKFRDEKRYVDRLKDSRRKTGHVDAMDIALGAIEQLPVVVAVQDFAFMGGSMGMAVGEALLKAAEEAVRRRRPLIVFTASGGARMQEGILSLMQMPRTTIAVQMVREAGLPYIVVHTHPTTGGVTASFAMLGDIHLAEPGALIGFAGPRVIESTIREKLPDGFQRAEFLRDKGMVDRVTTRAEMPAVLGRILRVLMKQGAVVAPAIPAPKPAPSLPARAANAADPAAASPVAVAPPALDKAAE